MLTLGLASNFAVDDVGEFDCTEPGSASSAAVLVEDGEVIAAHEEERFNRIPRSRAFPIAAIRACLAQRGVCLADIDAIAHSMDERSADAIGRMFGKPRLDVTEGAGRKLQFAGSSCTLDVYFYVPRAGASPVATHVDARTPDGRNAEVNSCAQSLQR